MNAVLKRELEEELKDLLVDFSAGIVAHPKYPTLQADVLAELELLNQQERYDAAQARKALAIDNQAEGERRNLPWGRLVAQIDQQDYHDQAELEPGCWRDPGFVRDFLKTQPGCAVKSRGERLSILKPEAKI